MSRHSSLLRLVCLLLLIAVVLGACAGKPNIVGRWLFTATQGTWDYDWMEFFEDGTCTDDWGNQRTWTMLSDGRLKITAGFGAGEYLFDVKISGDKMEITDEYENRAAGTRTR